MKLPRKVGLRSVLGCLATVVFLSACDRTRETYRHYSDTLTTGGKLRTERTPVDAVFSNAALAENFERIALNREYSRENNVLVEETTPSRISRWEQPIRYHVSGKAATGEDRLEYTSFALRLANLTGLEIVEEESDPNLTILILDAEERRAFVAELEETGLAENMPLIIQWAEDVYYPCVGQVAFDDLDGGLITGAMIVIKGELEGVLRSSCIHEELTQTLGLMNDDPDVRPSIFNDDQEFALLTEHDEILLRILYDRRLKPGMQADEARPLLPEIISEIRPGGA